MKKLSLSFLSFLTALVFAQMGSAATIDLYDYAFNIDGTVSEAYWSDPIPGDSSGFDNITGLGTISITVSGAGDHYVGGFFDHEIVETTNTFFNESGSTSGAAVVGQTWEIDEPGYVDGDIYNNLAAGTLDGTIGKSIPEDVSMAMAWNFTLTAGEEAVIEFILSTTDLGFDFYLAQTDADSPETIYFSSTLDISGGGQPPGPGVIPEPSTMILFGVGLLAFARAGRRQK